MVEPCNRENFKTPLEEEVEDWSGDTPPSLIGPGHSQ